MNEEIDHIVVTDSSIGVYFKGGEEKLYVKGEGYDILVHEYGTIEILKSQKPVLLVSIHRIKHLRNM